jgi:aerobic carbon-monoxide dehydrogenase large subunit
MVQRIRDRPGRPEDARLLTGRGRFLVNRPAPDAAQAVFLRSPVAHGRIVRFEAAAARAMPGVLDVITGDDVMSAGLQPLPCLSDQISADGRPLFVPPRHVLAVGRVRHVGEPIAMVVAETVHQARDAAEAIDLAFEDLPVTIEPAAAVLPGAPAIWPECPGNVALDWQAGDRAALERAFAEAAHVTRLRLTNNRVAIMPLETRAALGAFDLATGRYTLWTPSQGVHLIRQCVAQVLATDEAALRVVTEDVGGAFGLKEMAFPEQALVLLAAARTGRPVRWIAERTEAFVADHAARDHVCEVALALDRDGRMLGLAVDTLANMGAYLSMFAPKLPTLVFGRVLGGVYAIPAIHLRARCVLTNTPPVDAYRGAGVPEAIYTLERAVDVAAAELGLDGVALRRRNLLDATHFPRPTPAGYRIDSGDFAGALERAQLQADWQGFDARRKASAARGLLRGRGLAFYIHGTGGSAAETARVVAHADGRVAVYTGTQSGGPGHSAMLAEIVADTLGIDAARIELHQGDSDHLPRGGGTGGSGSLLVAGQAAASAARVMLEAARTRAADLLECAAADLGYAGGRFTIAGTDRRVLLEEVAAALPEGGCTGDADFEGDHRTYPNGVYICEVEVDPATGRTSLASFTGTDDVGQVLDPQRTDGQIAGGIVQGIGQALLEHDRYDPHSGQPLSGSFMDYALPRADDLPYLVLIKHATPAPTSPSGAKGVGEVGAIGAPPAVIAAVCDAIGVRHVDMPATSETVWRALALSAPAPAGRAAGPGRRRRD